MKIFGFYIARELPVVEKIVEVEKIVDKIEFIELGDKVDVYKATIPNMPYYVTTKFPEWFGNIYSTCHQALEECPGAQVHKITAYKSGKRYFIRQGVDEIKVQPKPRVPKGKAA